MGTHYETLGVERSATQEELHAAFKALAKQHHPDVQVVGLRGKRAGKATAAKDFAEITSAYGVLKDQKRRAQYDAELTLLRGPCLTCIGEGRVYKQKGFTGRTVQRCPTCNGSGCAASKEK